MNNKLRTTNYKMPRLIAFEVTRNCLFNCRHCRADAGAFGDDTELTTQQCRKILKAVATFTSSPRKKQGCMMILTGGEPMERNDIYDLIRYGKKSGLRMVMATCGYLIDDESITKLKDAGIQTLSFSLDGANPETHDAFRQARGAFEQTVKAVETTRKAGLPFQINTTITNLNLDEFTGIADLAKRLGAYCFNPFILVPTGRGRQIADEIIDPVKYEALLNELLNMKLESDIEIRLTCGPQLARVCRQAKAKNISATVNGCMGGRGFGFISYRGDVQTCGFLDISAGNLIENGFDFAEIWQQSKFLKEVRNVSDYTGNCAICKYAMLCGGCRARAYAMTGDYLAGDPICSYKTVDKH